MRTAYVDITMPMEQQVGKTSRKICKEPRGPWLQFRVRLLRVGSLLMEGPSHGSEVSQRCEGYPQRSKGYTQKSKGYTRGTQRSAKTFALET